MQLSIAHLPDRAVIRITGVEALTFLQDLITADVEQLKVGEAAHGGLLTPQGKILFDFFVLAQEDGVLLDCAADTAPGLLQRLTMYKLRKALTIEVVDTLGVATAWGRSDAYEAIGGYRFTDPRLAELGIRVIASPTTLKAIANENPDAYRSHRYSLGIADSAEIGSSELFPHEACYDQLNSVGFHKGCYVGQEVVSRMQHRGTARSRIVSVTSSTSLPGPGTTIIAGDKPAGTLLGSLDRSGLALIRLDRAARVDNKVSVDGQPITMHKPTWAKWKDPDTSAADEG